MINFIPHEARKISDKEDRPTYNFTEGAFDSTLSSSREVPKRPAPVTTEFWQINSPPCGRAEELFFV